MTLRLSTDRLHLLLALLSALTGTTWGIAIAVLVVAVVACRGAARGALAGEPALVAASAAVRGRPLAPVQHAPALHLPGGTGERPART